MKRFLEGFPAYPKDLPNDEIRQQRVSLLLGKAIYAGYVEAIKWGVSRRKGNHKGIISYKTFEKIQTRLTMGVLAPARKDISNDFSLRGFVTCGDCNKTLRSCWSTGKYKNTPTIFAIIEVVPATENPFAATKLKVNSRSCSNN